MSDRSSTLNAGKKKELPGTGEFGMVSYRLQCAQTQDKVLLPKQTLGLFVAVQETTHRKVRV